MNWRPLLLGALLTAVATARGEDKVKASLDGEVEVSGISFAGAITGDTVSDYGRHVLDGKISVATKSGRVHRVETYTEWSAENGVRGEVRETLYVSGGSYTGWTERFIQTPAQIVFSRNVINGTIEQEIAPDGSGFVEWTVINGSAAANGDDSTDDSSDTTDDDTDSTDSRGSSADLPTVDVLEQGEFNGVSDRRIDIDTHDNDHPTVKFRDNGYEIVSVVDAKGQTRQLTVNQKLTLKGHGKGNLSFTPKDKNNDSTATPTPTPVPGATPIPTATPSTTTTDTTDDSLF